MCGIVAILLHPQARPAETWQAMRETFTQNLIYNEQRGHSAAGMAVVQADGQVDIFKRPLPASEFVALPEYHALLSRVGPNTTLLLGHTRFPTKGTPNKNENNHPLQAGPVFGVHNGHICNDDALFALCGYPRRGSVDSEIIFRALETIDPNELSEAEYVNRSCEKLRDLQGSLTFLAGDRRMPTKLLLMKHVNPLNVHFQADWNALIFSSLYLTLRKTFGPVLIREELESDSILLFDALHLPQLGLQPVASFPLYCISPN